MTENGRTVCIHSSKEIAVAIAERIDPRSAVVVEDRVVGEVWGNDVFIRSQGGKLNRDD